MKRVLRGYFLSSQPSNAQQADQPNAVAENGIFYYPSKNEDLFFAKLDALTQKYPHDMRYYMNQFPVYTSRRNFIRQLAHYELFKLTMDLPGHYLDFGIYFGNSFFSWHKFLEVLTPTATHKKVIGFDTFAGFPEISAEDGGEDASVQKLKGGFNASSFYDEFRELLELHNQDGVIPSNRGRVVVGNIVETLPAFLEENPEARFCLVNIDVDVYEPTRKILELCWERMVPGAVLLLDEYGTSKWPGETRAWDYFARDHKIAAGVKRFPWANAPGAYVIKP
jgi:3-O-methyltransferase